MVNTELHAPTVYKPALAYDALMNPTLRGLVVNAAGDVFVEDIYGVVAHYTTVAGNLPYTIDLQIQKIVGDGAGAVGDGTTGTDVALTAFVPLT